MRGVWDWVVEGLEVFGFVCWEGKGGWGWG